MNFIEKWIGKAAVQYASAGLQYAGNQTIREVDNFSGAVAVVYAIDNGFLLRTNSHSAGDRGSLVYCADHTAIADQIVSYTMKTRLGIQPDLFEKEKQQALTAAKTPYTYSGQKP